MNSVHTKNNAIIFWNSSIEIIIRARSVLNHAINLLNILFNMFWFSNINKYTKSMIQNGCNYRFNIPMFPFWDFKIIIFLLYPGVSPDNSLVTENLRASSSVLNTDTSGLKLKPLQKYHQIYHSDDATELNRILTHFLPMFHLSRNQVVGFY